MSRLEVQGKGQGGSLRPGEQTRAKDEGREMRAEAPLLVIGGYPRAGAGLANSARPMWAVTSFGLQGWPGQASASRAAGANANATTTWGPSAGRTAGMFKDTQPGFPSNTLALAAAAMVAASSQGIGMGTQPPGAPQLRRSSSGFSSLAFTSTWPASASASASPWASSTSSSVASAYSYTSAGGGWGVSGGSNVHASSASHCIPLAGAGTDAAALVQQPAPSLQQQQRPQSCGDNAMGPYQLAGGAGRRACVPRGGPATAAAGSTATTARPTSSSTGDDVLCMAAVPATDLLSDEAWVIDTAAIKVPDGKAAAVCLARVAPSESGGMELAPPASLDLGFSAQPLPESEQHLAVEAAAVSEPFASQAAATGDQGVSVMAEASELRTLVSRSIEDAGASAAPAAVSTTQEDLALSRTADGRNPTADQQNPELVVGCNVCTAVPPLALPAADPMELGAEDHVSSARKRRSSKRRGSTTSTGGTSRGSTPRRSASGGHSRSGLRSSGAGVSSSGLALHPASPRAAAAGNSSTTTSRCRSGNALVPSGTAPSCAAGGSLAGARGSSGCGATPVRRSTSSHEGDAAAARSGSGNGASVGIRSGPIDLNGVSHSGRPPLPKPSPREVPALLADALTAAAQEAQRGAALCRQLSTASSNDSSQAWTGAGDAPHGQEPHTAYPSGGWVPVGAAQAALSASKPSTPLLPSLHVRTSGRLLDLPSNSQPQPHMLNTAVSRGAVASHMGTLPLHPDSPLGAAQSRLGALQSTTVSAACGSVPHSPAGATAGASFHPRPRRPSLEPLSPGAMLAGLAHATGGSGAQCSCLPEAEVAATAISGHQGLTAPPSPQLGPRPPSHLMPLGQPPLPLHSGATLQHTTAVAAAVGPASRVVSQLKGSAEQTAPPSMNLRGTPPAGFFAANNGGASACGGSPLVAAAGAAAGMDAGDGLLLVSGSAACKPKGAAATSRRSSRQASPIRASLFHTQQLNGTGGSSRATAASVDPEEQVRKAQERLEAYSRAQREKARAAEAEEAARRQRHADERNRQAAAKERRRVEVYALNALLALSEAARTKLLVEAMEAMAQEQAEGRQTDKVQESLGASEVPACSGGDAGEDSDGGSSSDDDDVGDSGGSDVEDPAGRPANKKPGGALLRHGV